MKKSLVVILVSVGILLLAFIPGPARLQGQAKKKPAEPPALKEKDLPSKYQEWLKIVSYIIMPVEKEVFMKLTNDRDRDIFIESFWKQRDPTPATPQNEYKDEHLRRFDYANEYYHRGTPRAGWMTDMGRIYIILGKPNSIERFDGTAGIQPCQVWYYFGDPAKRLPTYFGLVFFQRGRLRRIPALQSPFGRTGQPARRYPGSRPDELPGRLREGQGARPDAGRI